MTDITDRLNRLTQRLAKAADPQGAAAFVAMLMQARTAAHMLHLQQNGPGSYARHMALGAFYEGIGDLADTFAESYQGRYGLITGYPAGFEAPTDPMTWITGLCDTIDSARASLPQDTYLQNIVDEIVQLAASTKYKLTYLA